MNILEYRDVLPSFQESAPVCVMDICRDWGIRVWLVRGWPDHLSGKILRDPERGGSSEFAIFVNGDHPPNRQRFTVAHEVAHYVLHRGLIGDGVTDDALYGSGLSSDLEAQANRLAADTLMPRHLIRTEIEDGAESVEQLAERFRVSPCAMSVRLGVPA